MTRLAVLLLCALLLPGMLAAEPLREPSSLNVSIAVFDPGIPADRAAHRDLQVFPRVRRIESLYLPFLLRHQLAGSGGWGAIRVIPRADAAAELLVEGRVAYSDGETLELQILAVDASGRIWIDDTFSGNPGNDELFAAIATRLESVRATLGDQALRDIVEISLLRYAEYLAPAAFGQYLVKTPDNRFTIERLPAGNDPMVARIERIRGVEYVFTDAIDAKFRELGADVRRVYEMWREYRRKFRQYQSDDAARVSNDTTRRSRDSFESLLERYENYKWDRQAVQEQRDLAIAFDNEMGPAIDDIEARVAELGGWVEARYDEWRRLLGELFELETELPQ